MGRSTACKDWEKRIVERKSLIPFAPLFPQVSDRALEVFGKLKIVDAIGKPTMAETARPWVNEFVSAIFGAYDPDSGRRLITNYFLLISKKNGKSTISAGIMLTALILNNRESAEFLILAPTIEAAKNAFKPVMDMIKSNSGLSDLLIVQPHLKCVTHRITGATLSVVAAEANTVTGKKATGVLIDELWLFGKKANAESILEEATGGIASRPEGFIIYLSTQADEQPSGVFKSTLQYARDVRDGKIEDNSFLPVIYEFPRKYIDSEDYLKPENFYITNPNLGLSVDEKFLLTKHSAAVLKGEVSVRMFAAKYLNVEMGLNLQSDHWAGAIFWEEQVREYVDFDYILANAEVIDVGIDGGGLDDLLGFYIIGRHKETREWLGWTRAWAHQSVLDRRKSEAPKLRDFERDGDLVIVEKVGQDVDGLVALIVQINNAGLLDMIGVDPMGIGSITEAIQLAGIPEDKIIGVGQGYKLSGPLKTLERKLSGGDFIHGGQPIMTWSVGNAKIEIKGNNTLVTKQASGTAKIDPVMAMFNATALMSLNPATPKKSVYETRGIRRV